MKKTNDCHTVYRQNKYHLASTVQSESCDQNFSTLLF